MYMLVHKIISYQPSKMDQVCGTWFWWGWWYRNGFCEKFLVASPMSEREPHKNIYEGHGTYWAFVSSVM